MFNRFAVIQVGWSGGAMVQGKLPVQGVLLIWILVGQGLTALAVGAGGGCLDISIFFLPLSWRRPDIDWILSQRAVKPKTTKQPMVIQTLVLH